ncbi:MAG: diacylglycerol kinase family lipid kinase [Firmicutes bacterium]|nr:diacylglycerol kinase family lipid kinase [Bacillota bacterium]
MKKRSEHGRYFFIVNPAAKNGRAPATWEKAKHFLLSEGIDFQFAVSRNEAELAELARAAVDQGFTVVSVGGDGTFNRIAASFMGSDTPLGLIPAGTGNDFARTFKIPTDPVEAVRVLLAGNTVSVDLGVMNQRCFCNVAGVGLDAEVAAEANRIKKRWGPLAYLCALFKQLLFYRPQPITLQIDGKTLQTKAWLIALANGRYYGNGMMVAPFADPTDGVFEVIVVTDISRLHFLRLLPLVFSGKHINIPAVRCFRGREIAVRSSVPLAVHADGEVAGKTPLSVRAYRGAVSLLVPQE